MVIQIGVEVVGEAEVGVIVVSLLLELHMQQFLFDIGLDFG